MSRNKDLNLLLPVPSHQGSCSAKEMRTRLLIHLMVGRDCDPLFIRPKSSECNGNQSLSVFRSSPMKTRFGSSAFKPPFSRSRDCSHAACKIPQMPVLSQ